MAVSSLRLLCFRMAALQVSFLMLCFKVGASADVCNMGADNCQQALGVSMLQTARSSLQATAGLEPPPLPQKDLDLLLKDRQQNLPGKVASKAEAAGHHLEARQASGGGNVCVVADDGCMNYQLETQLPLETPFEGVQIVITRYTEDVTWLDSLSDFDTVVYNKGGLKTLLPSPRPNLRVMDIENLGREDETMLRHIVDNYDNASDITIFLQGWPYNHCGELGPTLRRIILRAQASGKAADTLMPVSHTFWEYGPKEGLNGLASQLIDIHGLDRRTMSENHIQPGQEFMLFDAMCTHILQESCPESLWVAEGAQWIVGRNMLQASPKALYERALSMEEGFQDEYRGLVMEALWPVVWGHPHWNPKEDTFIGIAPVDPRSEYVLGLARTEQTSHHCQSPLYEVFENKRLGSCEHNVGFCELKWYAEQTRPSSFYINMLRDSIVGADQPHSKDWSLTALLEAALPGRRSLIQVVQGEAVVALADGESSSWSMIPSGKEHGMYLKPTGTSELYLGCDAADNKEVAEGESVSGVKLSSEPRNWRIRLWPSGRVSFQAASGSYLCLSRGRYRETDSPMPATKNASQIVLICSTTEFCQPGKGEHYSFNQFFVKPLEVGFAGNVDLHNMHGWGELEGQAQ
mmetsp:Transcript_25723/g.47002  ORF Transcript_25723/g.47002 Transcript_25723/m.47002 type:complete len:634 (+) Transcript_25723:120-2021(+)